MSSPWCHAPFTSMYLDPLGEVSACCQNNWHRLGSVRSASLRDIWTGPQAAALREELSAGSFRLGCELCGALVEQGVPESAHLRSFDSLPVRAAHPEWPVQLELALSNRCNLQCQMCNGDLSSTIRRVREHRTPLPKVYGAAFFEELALFIPHLQRITFLGGEPFLASESLRVMELIERHNPAVRCHVTTNGTHLTPRIERFVANHRCHVAISVDGRSAGVNESIRLGTDHERVVANLEVFRSLGERNGAGCSLSFSLMRANVHEFGEVLRWADQMGLDVAVNRVFNPPGMSLYHLPHTDLQEVLDLLTEESAWRTASLERNRTVWERELDALSRHVGHSRPATPVRVRQSGATLSAAPHAVAYLTAEQLIDRVVTAEGWTLREPSDLAGRNPVDLLHFLRSELGRMTSSSLDYVDGVEVRTMTFDGAAGSVVLVASLHVDTDARHRWELRTAVADEPSAGRERIPDPVDP